MTLRLTAHEDEALTRLAQQFRVSKKAAALTAFEAAAPRPDHEDFVRDATARLMTRYAGLLGRLAEV